MDKQWFYVIRGDRKGPVTFDELRTLFRSGVLSQADLVWHPGFGSSWKKVKDVPALMEPAVTPVIRNMPSLPTDPVLSPQMRQSLGATTSDDIPPDPRADTDVPLTGVAGETPSATGALSEAWERTKEVHFRNSSAARWFSIGFCAWLASFSFKINGRMFENTAKLNPEWINNHLLSPKGLIIAGVLGGVWLAFVILFAWLKSCGEFMFIHRWYHPDAKLNESWAVAQKLGQSVWRFRLTVLLCSIAISLPIIFQGWRIAICPLWQAGWKWESIAPVLPITILLGCMLCLVGLIVSMLMELLSDFVEPVMYSRQISVCAAWRAAFSLCNKHPLSVICFYLVKMGAAFLCALALILLIICTLLLAIIPLMLPYLGAVLLLPVSYLFRGYAICYLRQWREDLVKGA
ncbi:MAG: DUF4339 domain-containing protein [Kiritimatiellae bacterium]|nr:DUF4339 domain-containing protein [Kiritimatiellia bacterium]